MTYKMLLILILCLSVPFAMGQSYTSCPNYNTIDTAYFDPSPGTTNHSSGAHIATGSMQVSCTYTTSSRVFHRLRFHLILPPARLHLIFLAFKVSLDSRDKIAAVRYLRLMMNTVLSSMISASPICCKRSSRLTA
jgi:hypothetical protein